MGDSTDKVDSSLHDEVQALLKGMNRRNSSYRGRESWSLEKKVETDPSCIISLIQILVKTLEKKLKRTDKINKTRSYTHMIPLLNTLYYVVIQSGSFIPTSLYQDMYECLMKMLLLPLPYSAVAQNALRNIRMEMITPGSLYLTRVTAEQSLKNQEFTLQEKVFVLADPAVFPAPLDSTVRRCLDVSKMFRDTVTIEKNLVLRALQKGLGTECQTSRIALALDALGDQMVEQYFQEVVEAMEQSIQRGADGCVSYMTRLQHIHRDILAACKGVSSEKTAVGDSSVCSTTMPYPEISFYMWKDENELYKLLDNFAMISSSSVDKGEDKKRDSVRSGDSGIEKDIKDNEGEETEQPPDSKPRPVISRRNATKTVKPADKPSQIKEKMEESPEASPVHEDDRKCLTARVVVMGDDRVLGKLTRAYHSIRQKESKRPMLPRKLNLELYYIPVTSEPWCRSSASPGQNEGRLSLASVLGRVDPWYNYNINNQGEMISRLPMKQSFLGESSEQNQLLDTLCYYLRCGTQPVNLPIYSVKMTCSSHNVTFVEKDVFVSHLEAELPEFKHLKQRLTCTEVSSVEKSAAQKTRRKTMSVFGGVITVTYTATSLSKREVAKGEAPMTCGVVIISEPAAVTTGGDFLTVRFDSVNPELNTKIQTRNISIKAMEHRTLSVCLDKDNRRTYSDVQRIEVSPCLAHKRSTLPHSKYLNKFLSLPINTFSGASP